MSKVIEAQQELLAEEKPVTALATTPMDLLSLALNHGAAIDVIERLSALQERAMDRDAEMQFNEAMNAAQSELGRIAPDLINPQTNSRYASYKSIDRILRPIYIKHGFSLSFNTAEHPRAEMVRVICYVSHRAGHTRTYQIDMPADGKGAKGGAVMTATHATGAANSYGKRYLVLDIFNIAVGTDNDGNSATGIAIDKIKEHCEWIASAKDGKELNQLFANAANEAVDAADKNAVAAYRAARDKRKQEIGL